VRSVLGVDVQGAPPIRPPTRGPRQLRPSVRAPAFRRRSERRAAAASTLAASASRAADSRAEAAEAGGSALRTPAVPALLASGAPARQARSAELERRAEVPASWPWHTPSPENVERCLRVHLTWTGHHKTDVDAERQDPARQSLTSNRDALFNTWGFRNSNGVNFSAATPLPR
jgi:hypothetical protein